MTAGKDPEEGRQANPSVPPLNSIYFYLTEGCNLRCRHCWLAPKLDPRGDQYPVLPLELFDIAVSEAKSLGLNSVKLTGGEPLLHPRFLEIIEIVRRENLALTIETNGFLCTPEIVTEIAKSPSRFVSVSLDGASPAIHDGIRGVKGSFQAAQQAVVNLAAAGIGPQIIFTVMRANISEVEPIVRLAERLGAGSLKFNIVQPVARGVRLRDRQETLSVRELIELGRWIERELARTTRVRLFFDYPHAFRALSQMAEPGGCAVCGILGIIGVIPSGQYALCGIGEAVPELIYGKVEKGSLAKIWEENKVLKSFREGLPGRLEGICSRCLMNKRCLGSCIASNYSFGGGLWAPFWFCREAEEEGLFPASRLNG